MFDFVIDVVCQYVELIPVLIGLSILFGFMRIIFREEK